MEEHTLPRENMDPFAIMAQLGRKLCHFVTLVDDLNSKLSLANHRTACLELELKEERRRYAQTNIVLNKIVSIESSQQSTMLILNKTCSKRIIRLHVIN